MVAYNLALALFPFALLVPFIFGQVIGTGDLEETVITDLQGIFPAVESDAVASAVERIRESSTTIGVAAAVGAIWIGASFWGAMDTAFCRIYHVECRSWGPEALCAGDAPGRHPVPRRQRDHPAGRAARDILAPRTCRSASTRSKEYAVSQCWLPRCRSPSRS